MNREERRKKARQKKKDTDKKVEAMRWVASLSPEKGQLIESYARIIADRDNEHFINALERCYSAAMINAAGLELKVIEDVMKEFSYLIEEDAIRMANNKKECGGDNEMAVKKVNAKGPEVEALVTDLLEKGIGDKEIKEIVLAEFPMLSKAMITNAVKKVKTAVAKEKKQKEEVKKSIEAGSKVNDVVKSLGEPDVDTSEALEYIFGEDVDYEAEKEITVDELEKEIKTIETVKKETKKPDTEFSFEILNEVRILDLKGKHANYHIEKNIVEVDGKFAFESVGEVIAMAETEREALLNQIKAIDDREKEIIKVFEKFM